MALAARRLRRGPWVRTTLAMALTLCAGIAVGAGYVAGPDANAIRPVDPAGDALVAFQLSGDSGGCAPPGSGRPGGL